MRKRVRTSWPRGSGRARLLACVLGWRLRRGVVEHDHDRRAGDRGAGDHGRRRFRPLPVVPRVDHALASSGPTAPGFLIDATAGAEGCLDVVDAHVPPRVTAPHPGTRSRTATSRRSRCSTATRRPRSTCPGSAHLVVSVAPAASTDASVRGQPVDVLRQPVARLRRPPPPGDRARAPRRQGRRRSGDGELGDRPRLGATVPRRPRRRPAAGPDPDRMTLASGQCRARCRRTPRRTRAGRRPRVASSSGRVRAITGTISPLASSGTTSRAKRAVAAAFSSTERARSVVP